MPELGAENENDLSKSSTDTAHHCQSFSPVRKVHVKALPLVRVSDVCTKYRTKMTGHSQAPRSYTAIFSRFVSKSRAENDRIL